MIPAVGILMAGSALFESHRGARARARPAPRVAILLNRFI